MGVSATGWSKNQDATLSTNADVESGDGGDTMPVWTADRLTKMRNLASSTFVNESSFEIPNGVVDDGTWSKSFENQEGFLGIEARGQALDPDGKPLTGDVRIEASGVVFVEETVAGSFNVSSPPPAGTYLGASTPGDAYDFRFRPSINGLDYFVEDMPDTLDAGVFQYGKIQGTITDYDGNPVPDVAVGGQGAADITDGSGDYVLVAPGGTTVSLSTLYGSYDFTVDLGPGETKPVDVTFPKLTIKVLDADLEPVRNAPVWIDGRTHFTGPGGRVELPQAAVKDYHVIVMGHFEAEDLTVAEAGQEFTYTVGPGASFGDHSSLTIGGVKINAVDAETGRDIVDVAAVERNQGVRSTSDEEGVCKLLAQNVGEQVDIQIGTGDRRYRPESIEGTLPDEAMLEVDVEMEPRTQVTNS